MAHCKTCGQEIPEVGKTGRKRVFCSDKCKLYYTNFVKSDEFQKQAMKTDGDICGLDNELLREWVMLYALDGKGAFRRKVLEPLYGKAMGISSVVDNVLSAIDSHAGNDKLEKLSEKFNAWKNNSVPEICPVCKVNWPSFNQTEWRKYCSEDCCNSAKKNGGEVRNQIDSVMIEKYGVKGGFTKERVQQFNDDREVRTGYRFSTQNPEVKEKLLKRMSESGRFVSSAEKEIREFFQTTHNLEVIGSAFNVIGGKQLDLFFPEQKLAVEYNGCFFHSEGNGGREFAKWRHVEKTQACEDKGIQLVHVWEDEWMQSKQKVLRLLEAKLGVLRPRLYARQTKVVRSPSTVDFFKENHIQGHSHGSIVYGLEFDGELVAAMSFLKTTQSGVYELNRFATSGVCGAFSKLLKVFCKEVEWSQIVSFGDRCVVSRLRNVYLEHGFKELSVSPPDYRYTSGQCDRIHKFNFRKAVLSRKFGLDPSLSEQEMANKLGFKRIYNCGLIKYSLKNEKPLN